MFNELCYNDIPDEPFPVRGIEQMPGRKPVLGIDQMPGRKARKRRFIGRPVKPSKGLGDLAGCGCKDKQVNVTLPPDSDGIPSWFLIGTLVIGALLVFKKR
jgi:hypothetical protein